MVLIAKGMQVELVARFVFLELRGALHTFSVIYILAVNCK